MCNKCGKWCVAVRLRSNIGKLLSLPGLELVIFSNMHRKWHISCMCYKIIKITITSYLWRCWDGPGKMYLLRFLHSHHGWEGINFMWKMTFEIFIKSLRSETPWVRKNGFYESVCLSVCLSVGRVRHNSR